MPKRSNLFQDVVGLLHRHLAGNANVEESALLVDAITGASREVDVVIRTTAAGHALVLSVEARKGTRRADVTWVEQMLKKHEHLPTSKLVLVSEPGFTRSGRAVAEHHGVETLAPEDVEPDGADDSDHAIVGRLRSLWPKSYALTPQRAQVFVRRPDGSEGFFWSDGGHTLYLDDGTEVATLLEVADRLLRKHPLDIAEAINLRDITSDIESEFELRNRSATHIGGRRP